MLKIGFADYYLNNRHADHYTNFYHNLAKAILDFFVHGVCPVRKEETLEILAIIDAARAARNQPDVWFDIRY